MSQPVPSSFLEAFALDRALSRLLGRALADSPLAPSEYGIYSIVAIDPEATVTAIAQRLSVPITTASDWVQTALARGHLVRERSETDARRYRLALTQAGEAAYADSAADFMRAFEGFRSHASDSEARLLEVLGGMRRAIDAAADDLEARQDATAGGSSPKRRG